MDNTAVYNRLKYKRQISHYIDGDLEPELVDELLKVIAKDKQLQQYLLNLQAISRCLSNCRSLPAQEELSSPTKKILDTEIILSKSA